MTPSAHIIPAVKALLAGYPPEHVARVVDAIQSGERVTPCQLAERIGVTRRTIWRRIQTGSLPRPQGQGRKLRYWDYSEVRGLL